MSNVAEFPNWRFSDPHCGVYMQMIARRYNRVVRFDTVLQRAMLDKPEGPTWYASKAEVIPFRSRS